MNCWICKSSGLVVVKESNIPAALDETAFRITDSRYGVTAAIYRCPACGFLQCPEIDEVLGFYEAMEDSEYEEGRATRGLQARMLLEILSRWKTRGRLLDVGAGSGILVEQARERGFDAVGIEPSKSLHELAVEQGQPVVCGTLPDERIGTGFDLVTLIDVIEHVDDPVAILADIGRVLSDEGIGCVVTPDVNSIAARIMGNRWWHYRIAHIGYFNLGTLDRAMEQAGLRRLAVKRPGWYFPLHYLAERAFSYLPSGLRFRLPAAVGNITVPLNLGDSLMVVFEKT